MWFPTVVLTEQKKLDKILCVLKGCWLCFIFQPWEIRLLWWLGYKISSHGKDFCGSVFKIVNFRWGGGGWGGRVGMTLRGKKEERKGLCACEILRKGRYHVRYCMMKWGCIWFLCSFFFESWEIQGLLASSVALGLPLISLQLWLTSYWYTYQRGPSCDLKSVKVSVWGYWKQKLVDLCISWSWTSKVWTESGKT